MEKTITLEALTLENVKALSEEEVSNMLNKDILELPKEKQAFYSNIIRTAFDFRSVSKKNRTLKGDMTMYGFKFFTIPNNNSYIMGIKRKGKV
jgi:hypothetical protein